MLTIEAKAWVIFFALVLLANAVAAYFNWLPDCFYGSAFRLLGPETSRLLVTIISGGAAIFVFVSLWWERR